MKTKRLTTIVVLLLLLCTIVFGSTVLAYAGTFEEECDTVFLSAFEELLSDKDIEQEHITINRDALYDLNINQLGYLYTMQVEDCNGYGIVIYDQDMFVLTELYLEANSPYNGYDGEMIYVSAFFYLVHIDNQYIETSTGTELSSDDITLISEKAYFATTRGLTSETEIIYFVNRDDNVYKLSLDFPTYLTDNGKGNSCASTAGASLVGYYTRFFPELMNGYEPGYYFYNYYLYYPCPRQGCDLANTLYTYMGTNTTGAGTTIDQFKNGMNNYVRAKGRNISFTSCMNKNSLNFDLVKYYSEQGLPMAVFADTYALSSIYDFDNYDGINYIVGTNAHAMAGFGYRIITYTLSNGTTRTDRYITVATGNTEMLTGYYNINYKTQVDEVYAVNIY